MRITATEANNDFSSACAQAGRGPVSVEMAGQGDKVILSVEHDHGLRAPRDMGVPAAHQQPFEPEFGDWMATQNDWVEAHGIPGADLRPW